MRTLVEGAKPNSLKRRFTTFLYQRLTFAVHYSTGDLTQGNKAAHWFADNDQHARAAIFFFLLEDAARARAELEQAKQQTPFVILGWFYQTASLSTEQRDHRYA